MLRLQFVTRLLLFYFQVFFAFFIFRVFFFAFFIFLLFFFSFSLLFLRNNDNETLSLIIDKLKLICRYLYIYIYTILINLNFHKYIYIFMLYIYLYLRFLPYILLQSFNRLFFKYFSFKVTITKLSSNLQIET